VKLFVTHGDYHCANCLNAIDFEPLDGDATAIGSCRNHRCSEYGKRFRVKLEQIEVEPLK
jgi:hypothetical protein